GNSIPCVLGAQNDLRSQQKITSHCGSARSPDILPTISRDVRGRKSSLANIAPNLRSFANKGLSRGISDRPGLIYGTQDACDFPHPVLLSLSIFKMPAQRGGRPAVWVRCRFWGLNVEVDQRTLRRNAATGGVRVQ